VVGVPHAAAGVRQLRTRRLTQLNRERDRQPARRIHLPRQDFRVARPPACPGYHAATIALTESRQGMATGCPVSSTTTVFGLAPRRRRSPRPGPTAATGRRCRCPPLRRGSRTRSRCPRAAPADAASAGLMPGSNSMCALGNWRLNSLSGLDGQQVEVALARRVRPGPPDGDHIGVSPRGARRHWIHSRSAHRAARTRR